MTALHTKTDSEEVEGIGEDEGSSWGDYPIDTVLIRTENRTVFEILRRINQGSFIMNPDFQRDFVWAEDVQSKFIESVLMRIPLPVFYLAENPEGRIIVVDGRQRLTTFQRFHQGDLRLKLPNSNELNNKRFGDLSPKLQNRIEDCNLTLYIIDAKVPERARLDIFERVNSGVPLTRQQMRNCIYMGAATRFLREETSTDIFLNATNKSLNVETMRDREFVNRFCAFQLLSLADYQGEMDSFLARALTEMNQLPKEKLGHLSAQFRTSLANNYTAFAQHAFRKRASSQTLRRSVLNASLWDVMSTGLSHYPEPLVKEKAGELQEKFYHLMNDARFIDSITYSPSTKHKVHYRFAAAKTMFEEVFGADTT